MFVHEEETFDYLELGSQFLKSGDFEGAIGACQNALYINPDSATAMVVMADALNQAGYVDAAILYLARVLLLEPGNIDARTLLTKANFFLDRRNREIILRKQIEDYSVIQYLGCGWEGAVYLTQNSQGEKYIAKVFHPHCIKEINAQGPLRTLRKAVERSRSILINLSNHLRHQAKKNYDALYAISLLKTGNDISGIFYSYEHLIKIQNRHLGFHDVRIGLVGAFLRTQAFLMRNFKYCIVDALPRQFMMTRTGEFRFIDYGVAIIPTYDFRCLEDHWEIVTLIRLLDRLFNPTRKHLFYETSVHSVTPSLSGLYEAAKEHDWLKRIVCTIREEKYDDFLDHHFYTNLASEMPRQLGLATLSQVLGFYCLSQGKRLFNRLHNAAHI